MQIPTFQKELSPPEYSLTTFIFYYVPEEFDESKFRTTLDNTSGEIMYHYKTMNGYALKFTHVTSNEQLESIMKQFEELPGVLSTMRDGKMSLC